MTRFRLCGLVVCFLSYVAHSQVSVSTYHNDNFRTGANTQETILTPANVNSTQFGKLFSVPVDGTVYAQPLYVSNVSIAGGTHNVLYVVTEHDSVYAIDADYGTIFGAVSLIAPGGTTADSTNFLGCADLVPEVGITGTPVIDTTTGTLYVVAKSVVGGSAVQYLHALDITQITGLFTNVPVEKFNAPVSISASVPGSGIDSSGGKVTFNPKLQHQRSALTLENGHIVIAWGSHCDIAPWHGWIMSYGVKAGTLTQEAAFNTTPNGQWAGVWMSGGGTAADAAGNIYFATGNGDFDGTANYGDSIVKLAPPTAGSFPVADFFTPSNQGALYAGDTDVASGGVVLLPPLAAATTNGLAAGTQLLAQQGKQGTIYLLNTSNLGKYCLNAAPACSSGDPQIVQEIVGASSGIWGSPAYWNGNLYWTGANDHIKAYSFNANGSGLISTTSTSQSAQIFAFSAPTPTISANGTTNGILWALDGSNDFSGCSGTGIDCLGLYAYDATNLANVLYISSQAANNRDYPGTAVKFEKPIVANGKVYVGTQSSVSVYGLFSSLTPAAAPVFSPAPGTFAAAQTVTISDATPNAAIYYTTNGLAPTASSTLYNPSSPPVIGSTETLQAIAVAGGYSNSSVTSGLYTISIPGVTISTVDLSASEAVVGIANQGSPVPNGGLDGGGNAYAEALIGNSLSWGGSTFSLGGPGVADAVKNATITLPAGNFTALNFLGTGVQGNQPNQTFVVTYTDGTSTTYTQSLSDWHTPQNYAGESQALAMAYRLFSNGTADNSAFYLYGYTFALNNAKTIKSLTLPKNNNVAVLAVDLTNANQSPASSPTFIPSPGTVNSGQAITISDTTTGATIYYSTNGGATYTPYSSSSPPVISATTTLQAYATASGFANSAVTSGTYTIAALTPAAAPTFAPLPGTVNSGQAITISDTTVGATIFYSTDGGATYAQYSSSSPPVLTATTTLQAYATASGFANSAVTSGSYTIAALTPAASPTFTPSPGTVNSGQAIAISDTTPASTIFYSTNGGATYTQYNASAPPLISANTTLQAYATASGFANSAVTSGSYTIISSGSTPVSVSLAAYSNVYGIGTQGSAVLNGGLDGGGAAYAAALIGTSVSWNGITFAIGGAGVADAVKNATIALPAGNYSSLSFLGTAVNGNQTNQTFTVSYTDGTTTSFIQSLSDWFSPQSYAGESKALTMAYRLFQNGSADNRPFYLYGYTFVLNNTKTVKSLTLPANSNVVILSVSLSGVSQQVATTPTFTPSPGTFASTQSVALSDLTSGASIYYTTDGSPPTSASTLYTGPISVAATTTVNAIAIATGYTNSAIASGIYTINSNASTPTFSPAPGTYTTTQSVVLGDATSGASIYYTTNGSTPTSASTLYTGPISVSATTTINAIAIASGYTNSTVATGTYTINPPASTPTFSPAPGTYTTTQSVVLGDATTGASIYYTTNGSTPTSASTLYTGPFSVAATTTVKAIAIATGYTNSAIASGIYTINPPASTPTFSPAPGIYTTTQSVVLGDATSGASIYYTTNGSTPTSASTLYTGPFSVAATTTVNAIAIATGYTNSAIASGIYTINPNASTPTFSPAPGTYTTTQSVVLGDATTGASIYYTTNGSTPTSASTLYTGPISVSATTTINAIAVASGYTNSTVAAGTYTINPPASTPTFSPAPGTYTTTQSVVLGDTTSGASIYYTTNGSTPTSVSTLYTGPISVSATTIINAIAVASGYTNSPIATGTYTIGTTGSTPVGVSLAASANVYGIFNQGVKVTNGGLDGGSAAYAAALIGTSVPWNGITFAIGGAGVADAVRNATITLPAGNYSSLSFLGTAVNGNQANQTFIVTYTDGTTTSFTQSISDWYSPQSYPGESKALTMAYRLFSNGSADNRPFYLYGYTLALNNAKTVKSLTLPASSNVVVLSIVVKP